MSNKNGKNTHEEGVFQRDGDSVPEEARRSSELNLTEDERAMLQDPDWVTEDEADAIISYRRRNERSIPLADVLKKHGFTVEGLRRRRGGR